MIWTGFSVSFSFCLLLILGHADVVLIAIDRIASSERSIAKQLEKGSSC